MPVGPSHECLRHKYRVETVRESDNLPLIAVGQSVAGNAYTHMEEREQSFREPGQTTALGKAEIVEVQVIAREDNGNRPAPLLVCPTVGLHIDVCVRDRFEEHLRADVQACTLHPQRG